MSRATARRRRTPDSHGFPTRPYDLVKEFLVALTVIAVLTVALAAVFSSPDDKAISLKGWAKAAPNDVVATAVGELAGTTTSAGYGPPYNTNSEGQKIGPLPTQQWGGVRYPIDSANDLVITPLMSVQGNAQLTSALTTWSSASQSEQTKWATDYGDALAKAPDGDPAKAAAGNYGPVPTIGTAFEQLAATGGLEQLLTRNDFYNADSTKALLLIADGSYLEDQARAQSLGGDQWGMMNETGNYPGQPWLWLYTFWYQVQPFASSDNADALVWGLMMLLTLGLLLLPFIPGLRSIPRWIPVHRLIWRDWYRRQTTPART